MLPITNNCSCGSIGRSDLRQCPEHFHIWNGDVRLASVGKILREVWPQPDKLPPADVLENARNRGEVVDRLFAQWLLGKLPTIPAGTREDAKELLVKLQDWFNKQNFRNVEVQVVLGCEDYGGVLDFRFDGVPVDLKCTYNIEQTAIMQMAAYASLDGLNDGYLLHISERFKEPKIYNLLADDFNDWRTMLDHWRMVQRRLKK